MLCYVKRIHLFRYTFNSNGKLALEHLKEKALHAFSSIRKQKIARDFHPSSSSIAPTLAVRS